MPIATSPSVPRPATFAKMEDRKRPASTAVDDSAPPSKRQAVNGSSKTKDDVAEKDKEELWIEVSLDSSLAPHSLYPYTISHSARGRLIERVPRTGHGGPVIARFSTPARFSQSTSAAISVEVSALTVDANAWLAGNSLPESQAVFSFPYLDAPPIPRRYLAAALYTRYSLGGWEEVRLTETGRVGISKGRHLPPDARVQTREGKSRRTATRGLAKVGRL